MKSFVFVVLALAAVSFSSAADDGQYRPEQYGGDDGKYRPEGQIYKYGQYLARNGKYDSIYAAYQPIVYKTYQPALTQQLLTPYVTYGAQSSIDQISYPSTLSTVTYRPPVLPVVSTVAPIVYSATAKPIVEITPIQPVHPIQPIHVQPIIKTQYNNEGYARILSQETDIEPQAYHYAFKTENGITQEESGSAAVGKAGTSAKGFYEYIGDDGLKYRVDYIADENGYRASGAHLPKA